MAGMVRIHEGTVVFKLHAIDAILSFTRTITLPLEHITSVSTERAHVNQLWE
jgi:hypothetical protein